MIFISILILIVAIALPSLNKQLSPILITRISTIIFLYAGALSFNALYIQSIGSGIGIYSGLFHVTFLSQLLEVFLLIIGSLILIAWPLKTNDVTNFNINSNILPILRNTSKKVQDTVNKTNYITEYSLVVLFSTFGASLLVSSADLVSMYLSIELQSFALYILATLYRDSESATKAGLKYFLLGGLSSCLILLGAGLIYTFTGLTNFESIYSLISVSDSNNIIQGLSLGLILIIVGFLFKIAAAPLHNWAPDVYDDSPTNITIWLTIMPKISILIFLLEIQTHIGYLTNGDVQSILISSGLDLLNYFTNIFDGVASSAIPAINSELITTKLVENTSNILTNLLLISSLLSLIIGTIVGLAQTRIKRLLALSTVSHIGFILLALSINTEQSIDSLIFYIIQYTITNLNVFLIIIALGYMIHNSVLQLIRQDDIKSKNYYLNNKIDTDIKFIYELKGQFFTNPLLSLSLSICLFSMAGIPPLIGFFSKQFVLFAAIESGYYFISIVAILVSIISGSYYLKIIKVLHTEAAESISFSNENEHIYSNEGDDYVSIYDSPLSSKTSSNLENKVVSNDEELLLTNFHSFLISSLTLSILLFILKPSIILNSTQLLSLSLYNY